MHCGGSQAEESVAHVHLTYHIYNSKLLLKVSEALFVLEVVLLVGVGLLFSEEIGSQLADEIK